MKTEQRVKHTAGPWIVTDNLTTERITVSSENAEIHIGKGALWDICEMVNSGEKSQANARLISVAPELLKLCKRAWGIFESLPPQVANTKNIRFDLEEAIRKAEGKE